MRIATLTLHPALDKSADVERMIPERKLRCSTPHYDAGGGGINVSKGIRRLGGQSTAVFPVGGNNGQRLLELLEKEGVATAPVEVAGETRENFSVFETTTGHQYRFTLPGEPLSEADAAACLDAVRRLQPDIVVASGSLPPGLSDDYYARVAVEARQMGARLVLDTSGDALKAALEAGVFMLKPNIGELSRLVGVERLELNQVDDAAMSLIHSGKCEIVVVSLGPHGALLAFNDGFVHVAAPIVDKRSTVGAGDSMVAGMVWALGQGKPPLEMTQIGVACGTAATMNVGTELFRAEDVWRLLSWIQTFGKRYRFTDF
ncbi:MAG: 1-phosphofructokinase family hexose kinase [Saprospiraceae bacterium]|nr:1-phosphofructokinase family hexose kinase [Saprospiraceae bacterium]MDW8231056.1 1-phosphofructokinase family hexose kinase [Saprospiraceae bacterium]